MVDAAPVVFCTRMGVLRRSDSFCATTRATMSVALPAAKPTTMVIGLLG